MRGKALPALSLSLTSKCAESWRQQKRQPAARASTGIASTCPRLEQERMEKVSKQFVFLPTAPVESREDVVWFQEGSRISVEHSQVGSRMSVY